MEGRPAAFFCYVEVRGPNGPHLYLELDRLHLLLP